MSTSAITGSNADFAVPYLSEDEAFLAGTAVGKLSVFIPSLETLTSIPKASLDSFTTMDFEASVMTSSTENHTCITSSNCKVRYRIDYTPVIYYTTPSAVYFDQDVQFQIDAKNTQYLVGDDDYPVEELRIHNSLLTTEDIIDTDTSVSGYAIGHLRGLVGDNDVTASVEPSALFKAGYAFVHPITSRTCNVDMSDCYTIRTLAKIDSVSANQGYKNGGQII